jgi:hypothetical protein
MQRRVRITLAVTAAAGALALGAGTAFAATPDLDTGNPPEVATPQVSDSGLNPGTLGSSAGQLGSAQKQLGGLTKAPGTDKATKDLSSKDADSDEATSLVNSSSNSTPLDGLQK